jgi:dTMP kinase
VSSTKSRGRFITFEGLDGSGKSTQITLLSKRLRAAGHQVFETAEPGGTPIGRQIRRILLDATNQDLCPTAEMLLMFACRAQNVDQWILPALAEGKVVISDRFTDSTLAYQGAGRGLGAEVVLDIDRIACRGLLPDLTIYIDIDPITSLARARARNEREQETGTRLEDEHLDFYRRVRESFRQIASDEPRRFRLIDGSGTPEAIASDIWDLVAPLVGPGRFQDGARA